MKEFVRTLQNEEEFNNSKKDTEKLLEAFSDISEQEKSGQYLLFTLSSFLAVVIESMLEQAAAKNGKSFSNEKEIANELLSFITDSTKMALEELDNNIRGNK